MQIKFYVPTRLRHYRMIDAVLDDIVLVAGGRTEYSADGVWYGRRIQNEFVINHEQVKVFEVFLIDDRPKESWNNRKAFLATSLETLANILSTAGEKSFLYTVDNEPTFVDLSKVATITL